VIQTANKCSPSDAACGLPCKGPSHGGAPRPGGDHTYKFPGHEERLTREQWLSEEGEQYVA